MEILPQAPLFMRFCRTENNAAEGGFPLLFLMRQRTDGIFVKCKPFFSFISLAGMFCYTETG